jgi:hypothetical protein
MNLLDKIFLGVGAGIALTVAIAIVWLSLANAHLRVSLAEAQENAAACQLANDDFREQAGKQDRAMAVLKAEDEARTRRVQQAEQTAQKSAAKDRADTDRLERQKSSGDDCKSAAALLDRYIAGMK